jgi:hypothetical protein
MTCLYMKCLRGRDNLDTLQGKQVIVTGGSHGFGRGIVEALLGAGARGLMGLSLLGMESCAWLC